MFLKYYIWQTEWADVCRGVCVSVQSRWLWTSFVVRSQVTTLLTFSNNLSQLTRYVAVLASFVMQLF